MLFHKYRLKVQNSNTVSDKFFTVRQEPKVWAEEHGGDQDVVTIKPWQHNLLSFDSVIVKGRKSWGAKEPIWKNEVIYYNVKAYPLNIILDRIVVHHTNNSDSISVNENKQQGRGYAALGYHFFIDSKGDIYEGRPLEVMGSHAGTGKVSGPLNDPDWGAIGIVLQGDYHHADDWFFSTSAPKKQLEALEKLIVALKSKYAIQRLLMHRETIRGGKATVCPGDHLVPKIEDLRKKLKMQGR